MLDKKFHFRFSVLKALTQALKNFALAVTAMGITGFFMPNAVANSTYKGTYRDTGLSTSLLPDGSQDDEPTAFLPMNLICDNMNNPAESIKTRFIAEITPSGLIVSGIVTNNEIGACVTGDSESFADSVSPVSESTASNVVMYTLTAGGDGCRTNDQTASFTLIKGHFGGLLQKASLSANKKSYICHR